VPGCTVGTEQDIFRFHVRMVQTPPCEQSRAQWELDELCNIRYTRLSKVRLLGTVRNEITKPKEILTQELSHNNQMLSVIKRMSSSQEHESRCTCQSDAIAPISWFHPTTDQKKVFLCFYNHLETNFVMALHAVKSMKVYACKRMESLTLHTWCRKKTYSTVPFCPFRNWSPRIDRRC
jgi:hypothetical protein